MLVLGRKEYDGDRIRYFFYVLYLVGAGIAIASLLK
jgi:hypothetical protein